MKFYCASLRKVSYTPVKLRDTTAVTNELPINSCVQAISFYVYNHLYSSLYFEILQPVSFPMKLKLLMPCIHNTFFGNKGFAVWIIQWPTCSFFKVNCSWLEPTSIRTLEDLVKLFWRLVIFSHLWNTFFKVGVSLVCYVNIIVNTHYIPCDAYWITRCKLSACLTCLIRNNTISRNNGY